jgi:hypothetical protein
VVNTLELALSKAAKLPEALGRELPERSRKSRRA